MCDWLESFFDGWAVMDDLWFEQYVEDGDAGLIDEQLFSLLVVADEWAHYLRQPAEALKDCDAKRGRTAWQGYAEVRQRAGSLQGSLALNELPMAHASPAVAFVELAEWLSLALEVVEDKQPPQQATCGFGEVTTDPATMSVSWNGRTCDMSRWPRLFQICHAIVRRPHTWLDQTQLGIDNQVELATIRSYARDIRRALPNCDMEPLAKCIQTLAGRIAFKPPSAH